MEILCNGVPIIVDNEIVNDNKKENYYVSYNNKTRDYGVATTALVITIGNNERELYYILKGNHSAEYENLKSLAECVNYFFNNIGNKHSFSDEFEHEHLIAKAKEELK